MIKTHDHTIIDYAPTHGNLEALLFVKGAPVVTRCPITSNYKSVHKRANVGLIMTNHCSM